MYLTYKDITSNSLIDHTKSTLNGGEIISYYIDKNSGWKIIERYPLIQFGIIQTENIRFYSNAHDKSTQAFIRDTFKKLDDIIDLDFVEYLDNNGSILDIYNIQSSTSFEDNVIGQALAQKSNAGSWWEIFWKNSLLTGNDNIDSNKNTIIHEIGHSLGLRHPFDNPTDISINTSDTVMSYNRGEEGWNSWFSETDLNALIHIWGRENDLGYITLPKNSYDYKYKRKSDNYYLINQETGLEDITDIHHLRYKDKIINKQNDIVDVFNLVNEINDITGMIYRLYNASFGRFPDKEGLEYWINTNKSGIDSYKNTAASFVLANEFIELYGLESSNSNYITGLYQNVLGRIPDTDGFNYWLNQINNGYESKSELLMGFSESLENKTIFSNETDIF